MRRRRDPLRRPAATGLPRGLTANSACGDSRGALAHIPDSAAPTRLARSAARAAHDPRGSDGLTHQGDRTGQGLIVSAPGPLRAQLRRYDTDSHSPAAPGCAPARQNIEHRAISFEEARGEFTGEGLIPD